PFSNEHLLIDCSQSRGGGNKAAEIYGEPPPPEENTCYRSGAVAHSVVFHAVANLENEKMKAIRVHEFGGPEVLKLEDVPTPKPSAGQVLVRIHAAGVNPYDTYMRAGTYAVKPALPYTPGSDGAGVVEAVGEGVKKVKQGDRVYTARTLTGA